MRTCPVCGQPFPPPMTNDGREKVKKYCGPKCGRDYKHMKTVFGTALVKSLEDIGFVNPASLQLWLASLEAAQAPTDEGGGA